MCIAILNKKEATLKRELLKNCWDNNGDGAGLLYIDNKKQMKTFKELKSFEVFYQEYSSKEWFNHLIIVAIIVFKKLFDNIILRP